MTKQEIIQLLNNALIQYEVVTHPAIYTVAEGAALELPHPEAIAKTLFLCDDKRENYFLVSLPMKKQIDLKSLRQKLHSRRLSFATDYDLERLLGLSAGAVSPFGALNDRERLVSVWIDGFYQERLIAVPLNENTTTVWLYGAELMRVIEKHGTPVYWLELSD